MHEAYYPDDKCIRQRCKARKGPYVQPFQRDRHMVKPKQDEEFGGDVEWRILQLDVAKPDSPDDLFVSFSNGRENGPIIERVGDDSPRMRVLDENALGEPWTTDPDLQRLGSWFITRELWSIAVAEALVRLSFYWAALNPADQTGMAALLHNLQTGKVGEALRRAYPAGSGGLHRDMVKLHVEANAKRLVPKDHAQFVKAAYRLVRKLITPRGRSRKQDRVYTMLTKCRNEFRTASLSVAEEPEKGRKDADLVRKWMTLLIWYLEAGSHVGDFWPPDDLEFAGYQGCGDLSMNNWNVALIRNKQPNGKFSEQFVYPFGEPVEQRIYTCLLRWIRAYVPKDRKRFEIRDVKFNRYAPIKSADRVSVQNQDGQPWLGVGDKVRFAVYGQQVIRKGKFVPLSSSLSQYSDLRHVLLLPNLNPEHGRPRTLFARKQYDDVWLGEHALLKDRNRAMGALSSTAQSYSPNTSGFVRGRCRVVTVL
jgi:hypothetical protein